MNINDLSSYDSLEIAKARAAARVNKDGHTPADRARPALLSYALSDEDWDNINAWFDELARKGAI